MTYREAVRQFKIQNRKMFLDHVDYWTGQLAWSTYTDILCKNGVITQKQYDTWATPFPYGKRLRPTRIIMETI